MRIGFYKLKPKDHPFPLFSWAIMIFQFMKPWGKDSFSHMAMCFESETGAVKIADVPFSGFREMRSSYFFDNYEMVKMKTRDFKIDRVDFLRWLEQHEHKRYDFKQIFGLALKMLNINMFNKLGSDFDNLICNELILSFLVEFDNLEIKDPDNWDLLMTWDKI